MDYKYIEQLLERYWRCETSLQEEEILRMFFSQEDIPAALLPYRHLFAYAQSEKTEEMLGDDFDRKVLGRIEEEEPVKARVITMRQRFMPLFKAAAVVAIFLPLGKACLLYNSDAADDKAHVDVSGTGYRTIKKLDEDGLINSGNRIDNYLPHHRKSLDDIDIE